MNVERVIAEIEELEHLCALPDLRWPQQLGGLNERARRRAEIRILERLWLLDDTRPQHAAWNTPAGMAGVFRHSREAGFANTPWIRHMRRVLVLSEDGMGLQGPCSAPQ